jgi:divalent metal cation (Fe/Co/Zn/Cd) transporter
MKQNQLIKNASYASVATGLIIFVIKFFGWIKSDSVSLFASAIFMIFLPESLFNIDQVHKIFR